MLLIIKEDEKNIKKIIISYTEIWKLILIGRWRNICKFTLSKDLN